MTADPMLDSASPITPLQSATILNALKAIVPQVLLIAGAITGRTFDVPAIQQFVDMGGLVCLGLWTIYYQVRTIYSRIDATRTIIKK